MIIIIMIIIMTIVTLLVILLILVIIVVLIYTKARAPPRLSFGRARRRSPCRSGAWRSAYAQSPYPY